MTPKIKFYKLPDGYSTDGDTDVQQLVDDELLPFSDKQVLLNNSIPTLTGVVHTSQSRCIPLDSGAGSATYNLTPASGVIQSTVGTDLDDLVVGPTGEYEAVVMRADNSVIDPTDYTILYDGGGAATGIEFSVPPPGAGGKMTAYRKASLPATRWALTHDEVYTGLNEQFNRVVIVADSDDPRHVAPSGETLGYVDLDSPASSVSASFWWTSTVTRDFIGEYGNWVAEHMETWPDVFVGKVDYPGDAEIQPEPDPPLDPGALPAYVDFTAYRTNFRDGMVSFPDLVDTEALVGGYAQEVRANYAHLAGIQNVTSQVLDEVPDEGGLKFRAINEQVWPESHNRRWVSRTNDYMPIKIYVDGVPKPTVIGVLPQETLTVKTS